MRLHSVELCNFGPYRGRHVFQISDRGLVLVVGANQDELRMNNNGSGKSTLFDSIDWCLWGTVPKGDHADSIIHDQDPEALKEGAAVQVNIWDDENRSITIHRFRGVQKKNGLEVSWGGKDLTALDTRETQRTIEHLLGMDRDVFHASVYYAQEDKFNFCDATDSERMSILTRVLQLEPIDEWQERAKAKRTFLETDIANNRAELARLEGTLSGLNPAELDLHASTWEEERATSLRDATRQLNDLLVKIEDQKKIAVFEERCHSNLTLLNQTLNTQLDLSEFDAGIAEAKKQLNTARAEMHQVETEGKILRKRRDTIANKTAGDCPECGQAVSVEHLQIEVVKLDALLEPLRSKHAMAEKSVRDLEATLRLREEQKEEQRRIHYEADKANREKLAEARDQMRMVEQAKEFLATAEAHCTQLRNTMAVAQRKVNPWREKQAEIVQRRASVEGKITEIQQLISQLEMDLSYYEFWVHGFGPKGLKSYILDSRLQEMTDAANEWVKLLTGGTIWVRFETQTQTRTTKKLSNKINLRMWRYNRDGTVTERNYRSWSGGEKKRVNWGVDFGLSRLVAARATKRYDVLILDEVFTHVDRAGGDAVVEMLHKLRGEKNSIFVIEQNSDFHNHFEEVITVRKSNGCAVIEEGRNEQVQIQGQQAPRPTTEKPKRKKKGKRVSSRAASRKKRPPRSARTD